jgi:hypothetical protein
MGLLKYGAFRGQANVKKLQFGAQKALHLALLIFLDNISCLINTPYSS